MTYRYLPFLLLLIFMLTACTGSTITSSDDDSSEDCGRGDIGDNCQGSDDCECDLRCINQVCVDYDDIADCEKYCQMAADCDTTGASGGTELTLCEDACRSWVVTEISDRFTNAIVACRHQQDCVAFHECVADASGLDGDITDGDVSGCFGSCNQVVELSRCVGDDICVCEGNEWKNYDCNSLCSGLASSCAYDPERGYDYCICGLMTDGDITDGDVTDGDITDGDVSDGDITDGDITDGDITDGDITDGDVTDGDVTDGDITDGDITDGDVTDGDITDGDITDGDIHDGGVGAACVLDGDCLSGWCATEEMFASLLGADVSIPNGYCTALDGNTCTTYGGFMIDTGFISGMGLPFCAALCTEHSDCRMEDEQICWNSMDLIASGRMTPEEVEQYFGYNAFCLPQSVVDYFLERLI